MNDDQTAVIFKHSNDKFRPATSIQLQKFTVSNCSNKLIALLCTQHAETMMLDLMLHGGGISQTFRIIRFAGLKLEFLWKPTLFASVIRIIHSNSYMIECNRASLDIQIRTRSPGCSSRLCGNSSNLKSSSSLPKRTIYFAHMSPGIDLSSFTGNVVTVTFLLMTTFFEDFVKKTSWVAKWGFIF
uniref:Uncharacterized protein n=1 Tax=Glossina austeni TaxID=7395 RepID=A0A1A9VNT2_GLOAU